jgi:hypothetical protein
MQGKRLVVVLGNGGGAPLTNFRTSYRCDHIHASAALTQEEKNRYIPDRKLGGT